MPISSTLLMASVWTRSKWIYMGRFEETRYKHPCFDFYEEKNHKGLCKHLFLEIVIPNNGIIRGKV